MATFYCNGETSYKTMLMLIFCLFSPCLTNSTNRTCPPDGLHGETNVDSTQYDDHFEDANRYWQFGSKSVYNLENTFPPVPSGCTPKQIFMIIRHGTRHPSHTFNTKMSALTDLISKMENPRMDEKDAEELKSWKPQYDETIDRDISDQGISDMIGLGQRVGATFKNLFNEPYDPANRMYKVESASESRCITSAEKFMAAVLGVKDIKDFVKSIDLDVLPNLYVLKGELSKTVDESLKNDFKRIDAVKNVLTSVAETMGLKIDAITYEQLETIYKSCRDDSATKPQSIPDWCGIILKEDLKLCELKVGLDGTVDEWQKNCFKKSDVGTNVLTRVAETMGLEKGAITFEQLEMIYETCRHDRATNPTTIPVWCKVFLAEDLKVMEYMDDIGWYYAFGYGCPFHEKLACPLLKQLIDSFRHKVNGIGPNGVFSFAHRSNQIVTTVMLGVAKDEQPLPYDNMDNVEDRKWKTSKLNPFGANTAAVLYKCDDGEINVSFYINEVLTTIELGNGQKCELCPWTLFEKEFGDKIHKHCDNNVCN